jgi:hypothetical protein
MAGIGVATAGFLLWLPVAHDFHTPIGSDAPVYLWWTRAAGVQGLSIIGTRSGVSATALVIAGSLHVSIVTVISAMQYALGICIAMSSAALARAADDSRRSEWILAGLLVGAFTVHLVSGYLSNLAFAALFIPAGLMLAAAAHAAPQGVGPSQTIGTGGPYCGRPCPPASC